MVVTSQALDIETSGLQVAIMCRWGSNVCFWY